MCHSDFPFDAAATAAEAPVMAAEAPVMAAEVDEEEALGVGLLPGVLIEPEVVAEEDPLEAAVSLPAERDLGFALKRERESIVVLSERLSANSGGSSCCITITACSATSVIKKAKMQMLYHRLSARS